MIAILAMDFVEWWKMEVEEDEKDGEKKLVKSKKK